MWRKKLCLAGVHAIWPTQIGKLCPPLPSAGKRKNEKKLGDDDYYDDDDDDDDDDDTTSLSMYVAVLMQPVQQPVFKD